MTERNSGDRENNAITPPEASPMWLEKYLEAANNVEQYLEFIQYQVGVQVDDN